MLKPLLIASFFLFAIKGFSQYKLFPKLEELYNEGKYDKCLEKTQDEIKAMPTEVYPYLWEMRCYIAIDELSNHPLKKNAITKALNIALKIKKKDKAQELETETIKDFAIIEHRMLKRIAGMPEQQYANALAYYEKLMQITAAPLALTFNKYQLMDDHNDPLAFQTLRDLVVKHYNLFKNKTPDLEPLEDAYVALMETYYKSSQVYYAKDVYLKSVIVYPKGTACKAVYLDHLTAQIKNVSDYTSMAALESLFTEIRSADSLFDSDILQFGIPRIIKQMAIEQLRLLPEQKDKAIIYVKRQLTIYGLTPYDSANAFFDEFISKSNNGYKTQEKKQIFEFWITLKSTYNKLAKPIDHIKNIHNYYINLKKFDDDFDFLLYCKLNYPALKPQLSLLSAELDKHLVSSMSSTTYKEHPELMDNAVSKDYGINSKAIKEKQYSNYISKLTTLLTTKDYSGFSVNIYRALSQYPNDPKLLSLKKQFVIADYKENYRADLSQIKNFTTSPDEEKCEAGVVSAQGHARVLRYINYFRRLAGVPDSCVFDDNLNRICQKAALMMSANDNLDHHPTKTWKCYTDEGAGAAGASNLSLGATFEGAIIGQMEDDGSGNYSCGHRRWILNPTNTIFGHGSTSNASSLYAFGSSNTKLKRKLYFDETRPVCWPAADYFPINLIADRWSLSLSNADFEKAEVTVTENGKPIAVKKEPLSQGYGQNTLVWVVDIPMKANVVYTVTVTNITIKANWWTGVKEGTVKRITYNVIPITIE
ncbi:MAG: CAP domain-containing protein [Bacteroidota bacterium]